MTASGARLAVELFVVPLVASAAMTWSLVGDLSERDGYSVILALPQSHALSTVIGASGAAIAALAAPLIWRRSRASEPRQAGRLVACAICLGCFAAWSLRVLAASTVGANIGGGLIVLFSPIIVIPALIYSYLRWRALT